MYLYRQDYTTTDEIRPVQKREFLAENDIYAKDEAESFVENTTSPKIHPAYALYKIGEVVKLT